MKVKFVLEQTLLFFLCFAKLQERHFIQSLCPLLACSESVTVRETEKVVGKGRNRISAKKHFISFIKSYFRSELIGVRLHESEPMKI